MRRLPVSKRPPSTTVSSAAITFQLAGAVNYGASVQDIAPHLWLTREDPDPPPDSSFTATLAPLPIRAVAIPSPTAPRPRSH